MSDGIPVNEEFFMRRATLNDSELIRLLRNTPEARRYSRNQSIIELEAHSKWFEEKLSEDSNSSIYIFEFGDLPIGMTRLDHLHSKVSEISVVVDPRFHKKGYGRKMLRETIDLAFRNLGVENIRATINSNNLGSLRVFTQLGFALVSTSDNFCIYELRWS